MILLKYFTCTFFHNTPKYPVFFISSDFLFPHCPTSFLYELLNPVKFLWSGFRALIRQWITFTKHVLLIIYYMYILSKKYLVMQYSYILYMIYIIFVSASMAGTDHVGLVTICRAESDPYRPLLELLWFFPLH